MQIKNILDPAVFDPSSIDQETIQFNEEVENLMNDMPPMYTIAPQDIRDAREDGKGMFGEIVLVDEAEERTIPGPVGDIPIRVFIPEVVNGIYLHFHGGGHVLGRAHHQDPLLLSMAKGAKVAVVSVDYRLAPEHPYPAGSDDCEAAAAWLINNAKSEFGTDKLAVGGESAGASLTASILLRLRDKHDYTGIKAANLTYGWYDVNLTPSVRRWGERNLVLTTKLIEWFREKYIREDQRSDPDVSTLRADLSNMPAALFTVGTLDPLLDDSLFMYMRWIESGNEAELAVYPGAIHGFNLFPIKLGAEVNTRIIEYIAKAVV